MKIISDRAIQEGERIPWGWGIAYRQYDRRVAICYPIPLNWLVGLWRELAFRLMPGPERLSITRRVYEAGYEHATVSARRQIELCELGAFRRGYEAARKDALEGLYCLVEQQNESPTL